MYIHRKKRKARLVVGEGYSEVNFLQHIKVLYCNRSTVNVQIKNGYGGSPIDILRRAYSLSLRGDYDALFVLIDGDCRLSRHANVELRKSMEKQHCRLILKPKIIIAMPCIEGFLCDVLNVPQKQRDTTRKAKSHLKSKLKLQLPVPEGCWGILDKQLLDASRQRVSLLAEIISIFED